MTLLHTMLHSVLSVELDRWRAGQAPPPSGRYKLTEPIAKEKADRRSSVRGPKGRSTLHLHDYALVVIRTNEQIVDDLIASFPDTRDLSRKAMIGNLSDQLGSVLVRVGGGGEGSYERRLCVGPDGWLPPDDGVRARYNEPDAYALNLVEHLRLDTSGAGIMAIIDDGYPQIGWRHILASALDSGDITEKQLRDLIASARRAR